MTSMNTLVVVPTYNEASNIEAMLRSLSSVAPDVHILVVDDASPDGTADIAKRVGQELPCVDVLERAAKNGLGNAYRAGFAWGLSRDFSHFVEIDCDFSHDPKALPELLVAAATHDVVIGSRYVPTSAIPDWSRLRRLLSRVGNRYAAMMLRLPVADATAGYRVYSRAALESVDYTSVRADGYGFQIEMTMRASDAGVSIVEVPIEFRDRTQGESKMSGAIILEALWLVTRWGISRRWEQRQLWSIERTDDATA